MNLHIFVVSFCGLNTMSIAFAPVSVQRAKSIVYMTQETSRQQFFGQIVIGALMSVSGRVDPAIAKESTQDITDKEKISKGLRRLNYLIENWEKETTECKTGNDNPYIGCERTPMKVMEYLGYKSMDDPLFKADKTLRRLEALVPPEDEDEYLEAVDTWTEKADEGSGMAYVSSWGESNPGGGKDRIAFFIERSKNDVIACRDSLAIVARILRIE